MTFNNKTLKEFYEYKVNFKKEEIEYLKSYALSHIINDEKALLDYAINALVDEYYLGLAEELKEKNNDNKSSS